MIAFLRGTVIQALGVYTALVHMFYLLFYLLQDKIPSRSIKSSGECSINLSGCGLRWLVLFNDFGWGYFL